MAFLVMWWSCWSRKKFGSAGWSLRVGRGRLLAGLLAPRLYVHSICKLAHCIFVLIIKSEPPILDIVVLWRFHYNHHTFMQFSSFFQPSCAAGSVERSWASSCERVLRRQTACWTSVSGGQPGCLWLSCTLETKPHTTFSSTCKIYRIQNFVLSVFYRCWHLSANHLVCVATCAERREKKTFISYIETMIS